MATPSAETPADMTTDMGSDRTTDIIAQRLAALRGEMARKKLDVYLVPSADEHQNEYLPPHKERRQAISGFTGSAGDVAITLDSAHLFVDSRYHLQAEEEAAPAGYQVHKLGLSGEPELREWLTALEEEQGPLQVGFDPFVHNLRACKRLREALKKEQSALVPMKDNLVDRVWVNRPLRSPNLVYPLPAGVAGESVADKLARVRSAMEEAGADALVLNRLDDVAWLTNLRGGDIPYNPVFEGYALVERNRAVCFPASPVGEEASRSLEGLFDFDQYDALAPAVQALAREGKTLWLDDGGASEGMRLLAEGAPLVTRSPNPVAKLKARKNPVEIATSREAHLQAGAAKVRSFSHLEARLREGQQVSELEYAQLLAEEYARLEGFADLSFTTISAFGANGAIVHYGTPDPGQILEEGGVLLVDSGVQILGATTDDTRTIAIGSPGTEHRERFTDVLRGHIRLAMQIFPEGTTGQMLDILARSPLWNEGLDYGHGTGHGVGAFLNVHEGPQSISVRGTAPLEPGMILSNEPGYYRADWGGIRCENLYVVEEAPGLPPHPGGKVWLRFSPLTAIPFDNALVDWERMAPEERRWLTGYHRWVEESLTPHLEEPHLQWLRKACELPE